MAYQHKQTAEIRWAQMQLSEQLANIGSEISRAIHWRKKKNKIYTEKSVIRALELIYLTIETISIKSHFKELTRLREAIIDDFYGSNQFGSSDALWQNYFNHFNYKVRRSL